MDQYPALNQSVLNAISLVLRDAMASYDGDSRTVPDYAVELLCWLPEMTPADQSTPA